MTPGRLDAIERYGFAVVVLLAMIIGGGTAPGLYTDAIVTFLICLACTLSIWRHADRRLPGDVKAVMLLGASVIAVQLIPLPAALLGAIQGAVPDSAEAAPLLPSMRTLTVGIGRTLEFLAWYGALALFLTAMIKLPEQVFRSVLLFFLMGGLCNLLVALIHLSAAQRELIELPLLPYAISAGFFANPNHLSAMVYMMAPLAIVLLIELRQLAILIAVLVLALLVLLAAKSLAAVLLGVLSIGFAILLLFQRRASGALVSLGIAVLVLALLYGVYIRFQDEVGFVDQTRVTAARTTMRAIADNWLGGIGFGNFVTVYPAYERLEDIRAEYINHVHNDYLELLMEGGLLAVVALLAGVLVIARHGLAGLGEPLKRAALLSVSLILLHSIVDYPLRTMALSVGFCLMLAIIFRPSPRRPAAPKPRRSDDGVEYI